MLIIDDTEQNLYMLQVLLKGHGYEVLSASNGAEGLEIAQRDSPDVIISDILMPVMDGFTLCRKCKQDEHLKHIPFIFYTATYTDPKDEEFALSLGATRFIVKPAEPDVFVEMLRGVIQEHEAGRLVVPLEPAEEETVYFKKYNEALIRKLEDKMVQIEQTNLRLAALYQASTGMASSRPLSKLVRHVIHTVSEAMGWTQANYFAFDEESHELRLLAATGFSHEATEELQRELVFSLGEPRGLVGLVAQIRKPLIVADTTNDARWIPVDPLIRSALFVPVVHEGNLLGVTAFLSTNVGTFDEEAARDVTTLANNMAIAIANTLLFEKVERSERLYRTILESSADAIISLDPDRKIAAWSAGAEQVFGYTKEEIVGQSPDILIPEHNRQPTEEMLEEARRSGSVSGWQTQRLAKDGRLVDVEITSTYLGPALGFTTIVRDITQRLEMEAQLRQVQKMESIGQLAGAVAHDFNNLLTVINGFADLIRQDLSPSDPVRADLAKIRQAGQSAADLTSQLLAFSRKQIIQPRILDLNQVVRDMDQMLPRVIREDIDIEMILAPGLWRVKADPTHMEQVIMNLAANARDAMPNGGDLTIETANVVLDDDYVALHLGAATGPHVMLSVSDTGVGMSNEIKARIFEPFFTTKEVGEGTGLGLATVYGIVKQSGGNILCYSEEGVGTTFKIYLPSEADEALPDVPEEQEEIPTGGETILLVEDEAALRHLAVRILESVGYTVLETLDVEDALDQARSYSGPIHLLLTDVVMPGMSGRDLADRVARILPDVKVVYMSGYAVSPLTHRGVLEPGTLFIQKPFSRAELARKVREALDQ